jgi:hypothetical protein
MSRKWEKKSAVGLLSLATTLLHHHPLPPARQKDTAWRVQVRRGNIWMVGNRVLAPEIVWVILMGDRQRRRGIRQRWTAWGWD